VAPRHSSRLKQKQDQSNNNGTKNLKHSSGLSFGGQDISAKEESDIVAYPSFSQNFQR